ncbi:MAG: hypothetical protein QF767_18210, partial [Alphaproteobacteria bacterium]|nr:hypothetical protein [Alphaproteobacteria bacterium]
MVLAVNWPPQAPAPQAPAETLLQKRRRAAAAAQTDEVKAKRKLSLALRGKHLKEMQQGSWDQLCRSVEVTQQRV